MFHWFGSEKTKNTLLSLLAEAYFWFKSYRLPETYLFRASSTATATATVAPTMGSVSYTHLISYCTVEMYQNALITAGVSDVNLVVAGPTNISGTAALVSAMKAYEIMTGETLSEQSVDAANNELVLTGEVGQEIGDSTKAAELIAALKNEVFANGKDVTDQEIEDALDRICQEMGITLDDATRQEIIDLIKKIASTDFDVAALEQQAKELFNKVENVLNDLTGGDAQGFFARLWNQIVSFVQNLLQ